MPEAIQAHKKKVAAKVEFDIDPREAEIEAMTQEAGEL